MNRLLYLSIVVFLLLLLSVNQGVGVIYLDDNIRVGVQSLWGNNLNNLIIGITDFGAEFSVFASLAFVVIYFSWKRQAIYIRFYMTGLFGSIFLFEVIKMLVGRSRPDSMMVAESALSFPSGHATIATVLAWFFFFAFGYRKTSRSKVIILSLCFFYPVLMAFTRVYLNVHYLSDVIAGIALGTGWMIFLSKFYILDEAKVQTV